MRLQAYRFVFVAHEGIHFPPGKSANVLRGAFGVILRKLACVVECGSAAACALRSSCPYALMFEPRSSGVGPSGLSDWPRPFVFRASHLDGNHFGAEATFDFDLHLFELKTPALAYLILAFAQLAREGLGSGRRRVELLRVETVGEDGAVLEAIYSDGRLNAEVPVREIKLPLSEGTGAESRIVLRFATPTELKSESKVVTRPEFGIVAARIRDRVSTLCELYGDGAPEIDFRAFGERASRVQMTRCEVKMVEAERRSSRTGQTHSLGGFVGEAEYEGKLGEFVPWLRAAKWTGVGRQTVWGKGAIQIVSAT